MISIIKNTKSLGISYSTSSLSIFNEDPDSHPNHVFIDDDNSYFYSGNDEIDQWWQVSFSKPVAIKSYIIRANPLHGGRPKSWIILASFNNLTWRQVDDVNLEGDVGGNKTPFQLKKITNCLHFRIVLKKNTEPNSEKDSRVLLFTYFDCFGNGKYLGSLDHSFIKYKIFYQILLSSIMNTFT